MKAISASIDRDATRRSKTNPMTISKSTYLHAEKLCMNQGLQINESTGSRCSF
jgi:hypothetical protein